jgi:hypothetical protein
MYRPVRKGKLGLLQLPLALSGSYFMTHFIHSYQQIGVFCADWVQ